MRWATMVHAKNNLFGRVASSSPPDLHMSPNFASNDFWVLCARHQQTSFLNCEFFHELLRPYVLRSTCSRVPLTSSVLFSDTKFPFAIHLFSWVKFEHTLNNLLEYNDQSCPVNVTHASKIIWFIELVYELSFYRTELCCCMQFIPVTPVTEL